ncbi:hypothetical protein B0T16DRAFT_111297 [Cercophora newfieldiana]|uniref:Uncharacterized protein n=1 Tax=Cercophora newfieldiana TaxID=92897 RepID=A0AA39YI94_9PEZI|nr:hypothetical protein B0T16DRAFT_111297 [Cercophora newfieldiana]
MTLAWNPFEERRERGCGRPEAGFVSGHVGIRVTTSAAAPQRGNYSFTVTTGQMGGIQRVDISLYAHHFSSKQLTEITKNVVSASGVVSSVDAASVTEGSMRVLVQNIFQGDKREEIVEVLLKAWKDGLGSSHRRW